MCANYALVQGAFRGCSYGHRPLTRHATVMPLSKIDRRQNPFYTTSSNTASSSVARPESEATQHSDEEELDPTAASTSGRPNDTGLFELYRTSVKIIVYSTAIVLGMASNNILGTWLQCACFMTVTMGLCVRDGWKLWEKITGSQLWIFWFDAVLFAGAHALAVGWVSVNILEFVGSLLAFWLLCSLHIDTDGWPFEQRRQRPQQPRQDDSSGTIALTRGEMLIVFTTVLCASISVSMAMYLMDQYGTALAREELLAGIARKAAAAAMR